MQWRTSSEETSQKLLCRLTLRFESPCKRLASFIDST